MSRIQPYVRTAELELGEERFLVLSYALPHWQLPDDLTASERDVVLGVLQGASRSEIAERRGSSPNTVANLLASAFRKLGVQSRIELAAKLARAAVPLTAADPTSK